MQEQSSASGFVKEDAALIAPLFAKASLEFTHGEGSYLVAKDGRRYLDFVAGIAVNALGHANEKILAAISEQAAKFVHISNLYVNEPQLRLARLLLAATGFDKVFFCNSGTEANEGAIKFARKFFNRRGEADRVHIVTFVNSFHGRTFAALSATGQPALREGFGPMPGEFEHIAWNDVEALTKAVNEKTCAVMLEPLAAEGGVMTLSSEMVEALNALKRKFGFLVIADEVQTGVGRLGTFLGSERYDLEVDLATLAKGVGGGLPLGAVLLRQALADELRPGDHGSTFGGNPVACAAGAAVVSEVLSPGFLAGVNKRSAELKAGLARLSEKYGFLGELRGEGLLLGITCEKPVGDLIAAARERGLLVHRAGKNVLRLLPPLNVAASEVAEALGILDEACSALA